MPHHMAYCSACDRPVPVDIKQDNARPVYQDAASLVCLEYPTRCTGAMCPMFSVSPEGGTDRAMREPEARA